MRSTNRPFPPNSRLFIKYLAWALAAIGAAWPVHHTTMAAKAQNAAPAKSAPDLLTKLPRILFSALITTALVVEVPESTPA